MFAERLKIVLQERNISQVDLAKKLGYTSAAINRWCQNLTQPDNKTMVEIAKYLKVSIDFLLGNDEVINNDEQELKEKLLLKKALVKGGYMNDDEDLTDEELSNLMEFVKNNKDFIKRYK